MKRPCLHRPHPPNLSQLGRDPPRAYLGTSRYLDSRSCILQRETVLRDKPQPQSVFARERNACLFLTQPNTPHAAKEGLGCLWLRGHCCLAGGLRSLKPTPNVFSFAEKADLAGRSPVCIGPGNPPIAS